MKSTILLLALLFNFAHLKAEEIDLNKSTFTWRGSKITGDFHSGPIKMKKANLNDGKGEFVADLKTIDDKTLEGEWKQKLLGHLKSADFFNIEKFPTATLKIEKMNNGYLFGKLTIKGKTNSVSIPYTKKGNTYSGELGFDRTQYDMVYGSGNFFKNLGDKVISDTVTLQFKVVTK